MRGIETQSFKKKKQRIQCKKRVEISSSEVAQKLIQSVTENKRPHFSVQNVFNLSCKQLLLPIL